MKFISMMTIGAVLLGATGVQAGGLAPAIDTTEVIVLPAEPRSSASDYVVPLVFLALAIAAANSDAAGGSVSGEDGGGLTDSIAF